MKVKDVGERVWDAYIKEQSTLNGFRERVRSSVPDSPEIYAFLLGFGNSFLGLLLQQK